jgi:2-methylcitrate dehydratase PrpD
MALRLAEFAAALRYELIPPTVSRRATLHLLDTVGVCLASVGMDYAKAMHEVVLEQGASDEAALFGSERRAAAASAALYNGSLAHGNDYDDTHSVSLIHISGVTVTAALATGERCGSSGKDVITALVAGYEVALRIGMTAPTGFHARGFHATGVCGVFGATVAAARLLGLDASRTANAIGIAGSQASGLLEFLSDGAWSKRMHPGWAAHAGIVAALLAARGFTGPASVFEGRHGFLKAYSATPAGDTEGLLRRLGSDWETLNIDIKPYPCGHISHPYMDCALDLRRQHGLGLADIEWIECRVPSAAVPILCEPAADKARPTSSYAARFSLPYAVAVVLVVGHAGIDEFSEDRIRDPKVLELARRCRYVVDDTLPFPAAFPGHVRIGLRGGRQVEARVDASRGSRQRPLSDAELYEKFERNVARTSLGPQAGEMWAAGLDLAETRHIRGFTALLQTLNQGGVR